MDDTPPAPRSPVPAQLPLLPVRDVVLFPRMVLPLAVGREKSRKALEAAMARDRLVFVATQRNSRQEEPVREDLFEVGVVAEILQLLKMPDGTLKILVEGRERARLLDHRVTEGGFAQVDLQSLAAPDDATPEREALMRHARGLFEQYVKLQRRVPAEVLPAVGRVDRPGRLADAVAGHLVIKVADKQEILEAADPKRRLERVAAVLEGELEILQLEKRIQARVRTQIEKSQKEYYLTEQMKAIQKELRKKDDFTKEIDELRRRAPRKSSRRTITAWRNPRNA